MSWTDEEIDKLFQESATAQSFEYDNTYFSEIEAALPVGKRGKDFLWLGTALLFIGVLTTGYFANNSTIIGTINGNQLAATELEDLTTNTNTLENSTSTSIKTAENTALNSELNGAVANEGTAPLKSIGNKGNNSSSAQSAGESTVATSTPQGKTIQLDVSAPVQRNLAKLLNANIAGAQASIGGETSEANSGGNQTQANQILGDVAAITSSLDTKTLEEIDQNLNRDLVPNALPMLSELRPKSAFYLELNGGLSQSLVTPSDYTFTSIGGGFGVESYLGNFNLTTGLNFKLSDHKDLQLTRSWKQYNFGSTSGMDTYKYGKIYSLELPVSLGYSFGQHNFNVGVRPSLLIGAKITHESFENEELTRKEKMYGLAGGLTRFGLKPTLGYSYHVNKWTIGANLGVQLLQSVNEEFIDKQNNRFPIDGQLYLRRTIRLRK